MISSTFRDLPSLNTHDTEAYLGLHDPNSNLIISQVHARHESCLTSRVGIALQPPIP
jgi:hypothetical protein